MYAVLVEEVLVKLELPVVVTRLQVATKVQPKTKSCLGRGHFQIDGT